MAMELLVLTAALATVPPIHLTTTGIPGEMVVSWSSPGAPIHDNETLSCVRYGYNASSLTKTATATPSVMTTDTEDLATYDYCGIIFETHTLHMVRLADLRPADNVYYTVDSNGCSTGQTTDRERARETAAATTTPQLSRTHRFRTPPLDPASSVRFLATADVGDPVSHPWTALPEMARECTTSDPSFSILNVTLGLHIGDIAYNLGTYVCTSCGTVHSLVCCTMHSHLRRYCSHSLLSSLSLSLSLSLFRHQPQWR